MAVVDAAAFSPSVPHLWRQAIGTDDFTLGLPRCVVGNDTSSIPSSELSSTDVTTRFHVLSNFAHRLTRRAPVDPKKQPSTTASLSLAPCQKLFVRSCDNSQLRRLRRLHPSVSLPSNIYFHSHKKRDRNNMRHADSGSQDEVQLHDCCHELRYHDHRHYAPAV